MTCDDRCLKNRLIIKNIMAPVQRVCLRFSLVTIMSMWMGARSRKLCVNSSLTQDIRVLLAVLLKMQFFWDVMPCS